jgi:hypothetical protein
LISLEFRLGLFGFESFSFQPDRYDQFVVDDQNATFQLDEKRPEAEIVDRKAYNIDYYFTQNDGDNNNSYRN